MDWAYVWLRQDTYVSLYVICTHRLGIHRYTCMQTHTYICYMYTVDAYTHCSRTAGFTARSSTRPRDSEGGMMWLETLIELKFLNSSFSSLSSCWHWTNGSLSSNSRQQYLSQQYPPPLLVTRRATWVECCSAQARGLQGGASTALPGGCDQLCKGPRGAAACHGGRRRG